MIRGCETEYAGVVFRSRLEAEWALRFSRLRVEWVYEPCRIRLGGRSSYTPDFSLPKYGTLLQIKPGLPDQKAADAAGLAVGVLGVPLYFLCGHPDTAPRLAKSTRLGRDVWGWELLGSVPFPV